MKRVVVIAVALCALIAAVAVAQTGTSYEAGDRVTVTSGVNAGRGGEVIYALQSGRYAVVLDGYSTSDGLRFYTAGSIAAISTPTPTPTPSPTPEPTPSPTPEPTPDPTPSPTPEPTPSPTPTPEPTPEPTPQPTGCDRNATTATFAAEVTAATAGQTVCLAAGSYGTWNGTDKAIIVRSADGQTATLALGFTTGDRAFTLERVRITGGSITNGARDITIRDSEFTGAILVNGLANSNVLLDHNTHVGINAGARPGRIHLAYNSQTHSGVTIRNSLLQGGDSDGIQTGVGVNVIDNTFRDILEGGPNHTDAIQMIGAPGSIVRGNWFDNVATGIVAYDGLERATIENNVVTTSGRPWAIELYSDDSSIVRHNTLPHRSGCDFNQQCGTIMLTHKDVDDASRNTVIVDNIATEVAEGDRAGERHHNLVRRNAGTGDTTGTPVYTDTSTYEGHRLATGSPGENAASDGTDIGIP